MTIIAANKCVVPPPSWSDHAFEMKYSVRLQLFCCQIEDVPKYIEAYGVDTVLIEYLLQFLDDGLVRCTDMDCLLDFEAGLVEIVLQHA